MCSVIIKPSLKWQLVVSAWFPFDCVSYPDQKCAICRYSWYRPTRRWSDQPEKIKQRPNTIITRINNKLTWPFLMKIDVEGNWIRTQTNSSTCVCSKIYCFRCNGQNSMSYCLSSIRPFPGNFWWWESTYRAANRGRHTLTCTLVCAGTCVKLFI